MSGFLVVRLDDSKTGGYDCNMNAGRTGLAVIWVMVTLALIVVTARVYAQARLTKQFGLSDYLMICSVAIVIGFASLISVQYHYGWGMHQACIKDPKVVETQLKFNVTGQSFGIMASTFGRLSFIVFMLHLFEAKTWPRWSLRVFFVLQVITNVGTVIACYAQCTDPRALYDTSLPASLCWPADIQTMATRLKIGLAILLGMSSVALVGLIMKCVYLKALSNRGDISYETVPMFTWITVEGTLVEIAASVPLLRPLFKRRFNGLRSNNKPSSYELPRYAAHSGQTGSSGFSKRGKGRTTFHSGLTTAGVDDDSSMEGILPMQTKNDNDESITVRQDISAHCQDASQGVDKEDRTEDRPAETRSDPSLSDIEQQNQHTQLG
ncbi:hypothetical protein SLS53_006942 [Cytospora paraplurivora]|uniref:Rhodopsin domain-containing protein n=1 Tax=Cytospora paraplurivora TaxID=2898453 RepID=A0AAN9YE54_9PEZI